MSQAVFGYGRSSDVMPSLSHDRKCPCLSKCMHSWMVGRVGPGQVSK